MSPEGVRAFGASVGSQSQWGTELQGAGGSCRLKTLKRPVNPLNSAVRRSGRTLSKAASVGC